MWTLHGKLVVRNMPLTDRPTSSSLFLAIGGTQAYQVVAQLVRDRAYSPTSKVREKASGVAGGLRREFYVYANTYWAYLFAYNGVEILAHTFVSHLSARI